MIHWYGLAYIVAVLFHPQIIASLYDCDKIKVDEVSAEERNLPQARYSLVNLYISHNSGNEEDNQLSD